VGKPVLQFVDFINAAKNIEISYKTNLSKPIAERNPNKNLLSTCTTLSQSNGPTKTTQKNSIDGLCTMHTA
jgi:hypothetical protein